MDLTCYWHEGCGSSIVLSATVLIDYCQYILGLFFFFDYLLGILAIYCLNKEEVGAPPSMPECLPMFSASHCR